MKAKRLKNMPANVLAILISLVMFVPIYLLFVNSLKDEIQSRAMEVELPTSVHLENYLTVIEQGKLGITFANSMLYATGATIIVVILSTAAAFGSRVIDPRAIDSCTSSLPWGLPLCSYQNSLWSFPDLCVY